MANGTSGGMRALKIATIAMGVLIVLGTTVILVTIVKRTMWEPGSSGPTGSAGQPFAAVLDEPAGTGIVSIAQVRERLAQIEVAKKDEIALAPEAEIGRVWSVRRAVVYRTAELLIDPATGAVVGKVSLAR